MWYECIKQDTFNKLEVGKQYYIDNNILYNDNKTIKMYRITDWQLNTMFRKVLKNATAIKKLVGEKY